MRRLRHIRDTHMRRPQRNRATSMRRLHHDAVNLYFWGDALPGAPATAESCHECCCSAYRLSVAAIDHNTFRA